MLLLATVPSGTPLQGCGTTCQLPLEPVLHSMFLNRISSQSFLHEPFKIAFFDIVGPICVILVCFYVVLVCINVAFVKHFEQLWLKECYIRLIIITIITIFSMLLTKSHTNVQNPAFIGIAPLSCPTMILPQQKVLPQQLLGPDTIKTQTNLEAVLFNMQYHLSAWPHSVSVARTIILAVQCDRCHDLPHVNHDSMIVKLKHYRTKSMAAMYKNITYNYMYISMIMSCTYMQL